MSTGAKITPKVTLTPHGATDAAAAEGIVNAASVTDLHDSVTAVGNARARADIVGKEVSGDVDLTVGKSRVQEISADAFDQLRARLAAGDGRTVSGSSGAMRTADVHAKGVYEAGVIVEAVGSGKAAVGTLPAGHATPASAPEAPPPVVETAPAAEATVPRDVQTDVISGPGAKPAEVAPTPEPRAKPKMDLGANERAARATPVETPPRTEPHPPASAPLAPRSRFQSFLQLLGKSVFAQAFKALLVTLPASLFSSKPKV